MKRMGGLEHLRFIGRLKTSLTTFVLLALLLILVNNVSLSESVQKKAEVKKGDKFSKRVEPPLSHVKMPHFAKTKVKHANKTVVLPAHKLVESLNVCPTTSSKTSQKCRRRKKQQEKLRKSDITQVLTKRRKEVKSYLSPFNIDNRYPSNISYSNDLHQNGGLIPVPKSLLNVKQLTPENLKEINKFIKSKRRLCKSRSFKGFSCQKLKFSTWLAKLFERNSTKLNSWLEIVKLSENEHSNSTQRSLSSSSPSSFDLNIRPMYWPEKILYRLVRSWGDPEDLFLFYKYKDYLRSRELKISLPYHVELKVSPKSANELGQGSRALSKSSEGTGRIFWDPGFNLKLKLPFFRDELKVAVSTGPSFIAGIGVGIAILIVKSMFAPFLIAVKWLFYNIFLKESGPFDVMKMFFLSHAPESWDPPVPPPSIDHYHTPPVHNPYDHHPHHHHPPPPPPPYGRPYHRGPPPPPPPRHYSPFHRRPKPNYGPPPPPPPPSLYGSPTSPGPSYDFDYSGSGPPYDLKFQYSDSTPLMQSVEHVNPTMSQLEQLYRAQLLEEGLGLNRPGFNSLLEPEPTNAIDVGDSDSPAIMDSMRVNIEPDNDSQQYIPSTGLQAEVEHFDPFYSPLLSKIDSIFTHLGHNDEGCRERVVCSIYKFPVKYAPYSNLISAQLSKHQSELKRPVTPSPKILRYFRYMKAAKDGQGGENCSELYPKCNSDTDAVSSLPMITTFHQLSELMTAESSSPAVALATAG